MSGTIINKLKKMYSRKLCDKYKYISEEEKNESTKINDEEAAIIK